MSDRTEERLAEIIGTEKYAEILGKLVKQERRDISEVTFPEAPALPSVPNWARRAEVAEAKVAAVESLLDYIEGRDEHVAYQLRAVLASAGEGPDFRVRGCGAKVDGQRCIHPYGHDGYHDDGAGIRWTVDTDKWVQS